MTKSCTSLGKTHLFDPSLYPPRCIFCGTLAKDSSGAWLAPKRPVDVDLRPGAINAIKLTEE